MESVSEWQNAQNQISRFPCHYVRCNNKRWQGAGGFESVYNKKNGSDTEIDNTCVFVLSKLQYIYTIMHRFNRQTSVRFWSRKKRKSWCVIDQPGDGFVRHLQVDLVGKFNLIYNNQQQILIGLYLSQQYAYKCCT